jgi:hypothetical protein
MTDAFQIGLKYGMQGALQKKSKVFQVRELPAWIRRGGYALKRFREASLTREDGAVD